VVSYPDTQTTESSSNRLTVEFWPTADKAYVLYYQILVRPDFAAGIDLDGTDDTNRYLLGSSEHSETIMQACLSVAEQFTERNARKEEEAF